MTSQEPESALNSTATYGARPLGALLGAVISARMGLEVCLFAAVAGFAVQALIIVVSPAARLDAIPDPPAVQSGRRDRAGTPAATPTAC